MPGSIWTTGKLVDYLVTLDPATEVLIHDADTEWHLRLGGMRLVNGKLCLMSSYGDRDEDHDCEV